MVRNSYDMIALNSAIDALDNKISGKLQLELYATIEDLLLDRIVWFVRNVDVSKSLADVVEHYRAGIEAVADALRQRAARGCRRSALAARAAELTSAGVPEELARRIASLRALSSAPDIVSVADRTGKPVQDVAATYFAAGAFFQLDRIASAAREHPCHRLFRPARARPCARLDRRGGAAARPPRWSGNGVDRHRRRSRPGSGRAPARSSASALAVHGIASSGLTLSKLSVAASLLGDLVKQ